MDLAASLVEVGLVARPHGVRGELRVVLHNPDSDVLERAQVVYIDGVPHSVESARPVAGAVLLALAGILDRDQADGLRGRPVSVGRADIRLDEGEVLVADLVGCAAVLADGTPWGEIAAVEPGPQWRLVVRAGEREWLLPLVPEFLLEVDRVARRVVLAPPEDLPESKTTPRRSRR
jgi:16S rRNA processing protein RimM